MIKLLFAGDFIPPQTGTNVYSEELNELLKNKDFSFLNLEAPITENTRSIRKTGNSFKLSSDTIKHITSGYFDAVCLSNNHIRDFGDKGVNNTIRLCLENNIQTVGAGKNIQEARKPLRIIIKGKKIAIINYSEKEFNIASETKAGANPFDPISAYYDIQTEKQENDYLLVIYHGGIEYQHYPTMEIIKSFKFMVDAGADTVIAHHTHRYSGMIYYKQKPLLFGLGNFLCPTKTMVKDDWLIGLLAIMELNEHSIDVKLQPVKMNESFDKVDLVASDLKNNILAHSNEISSKINNESWLLNYWQRHDKSEKQKILDLLKSNTKLEYRLRKYLPAIFKSQISQHKKNILLNMLRCDSHRNRLIRILEEK